MPTQPTDHKPKTQKPKKNGVSSAKDFKKKSAVVELKLPSGHTCLAKPMRITKMLEEGFFPDDLRAVIMKQIGEEKPDDKAVSDSMSSVIGDMGKLNELMQVFDRITATVIVEPKVYMAPEDDADRDEELLYADEVDMEDKTFIFQWAVGGDKDLERFRSEFGSSLGSLDTL